MAGILLTCGPVSTQEAVKKTGSIFKFTVTKAKFETAANKLQAEDLGVLVQSSRGIFIKKAPGEIHDILLKERNSDLCTPQEYDDRYCMPAPGSITINMRRKLIEQSLVAESLLLPMNVLNKGDNLSAQRGGMDEGEGESEPAE